MLNSHKLAVVIAIPIVALVVICAVWIYIWRYVPKGGNRLSRAFDRRDDPTKNSIRQGIMTPLPTSSPPPSGLRQYQPRRTSYPRPESLSRVPASPLAPVTPTGTLNKSKSVAGVADAQYAQYAERTPYAWSETMANSTGQVSGSGSSAYHPVDEFHPSTMSSSPRTGTPGVENILQIQQRGYSPSTSPSQSQFHSDTHSQPQSQSQYQPQPQPQHRPHLQARDAKVQRHDIHDLVSFLDGTTSEEVRPPPSYRSRNSGEGRKGSSFRFSKDGTAKSITFSPLSDLHQLPQLPDEELQPEYSTIEENSPLDTLVEGEDGIRDRKARFTGGSNFSDREGGPLAFHMPRYPPAVIVNQSVETHSEGPRILGKSPPGANAKVMPPIASVYEPVNSTTTPKHITFTNQTHPRRGPSVPPVLPPIPTSPTNLSPLDTEHSLDVSGDNPHEPPEPISIIPNLDDSPTDTPLAETAVKDKVERAIRPLPPVPVKVPTEAEELPTVKSTVEAEGRKEGTERVENAVKSEKNNKRKETIIDGRSILPIMESESQGSSIIRDRDGLESGWY